MPRASGLLGPERSRRRRSHRGLRARGVRPSHRRPKNRPDGWFNRGLPTSLLSGGGGRSRSCRWRSSTGNWDVHAIIRKHFLAGAW